MMFKEFWLSCFHFDVKGYCEILGGAIGPFINLYQHTQSQKHVNTILMKLLLNFLRADCRDMEMVSVISSDSEEVEKMN